MRSIPHFPKGDPRNLDAANARREEICSVEGRRPGRPKGTDNKTARLTLSFTASEYATVSECAAQGGCSIASIMHQAIAEFCGKRPEHAVNVVAARAMRAKQLREEDAKLRMVTPPEELPSWKWFDPKRKRYHDITREFCGDPSAARSALGGWRQLGDEFDDAGHSDSERALGDIRRGEL
jgi:hypothetical protein